MHEIGDGRRKLHRCANRGAAQAVADVRRGVGGVERLQVIADGDALSELLELGPSERLAQIRLAHEHNLNQLRFFSLEVRQHPDLLEGRHAEVLGLIDHEQGLTAVAALFHEKAGEVTQQVGLATVGAGIEAEVEHDRLDELTGVELRVHESRDGRLMVQSPQRGLQQRRLARSDVAGEDHESRMSLQPVAEIVQRFTVDSAQIQVVGIGAE